MTTDNQQGIRCQSRWRFFLSCNRGSSAVEFALVALPVIMLVMGIIQIGIFYITQSALDNGVVQTAELLRNNFTTGSSASLPAAASLKTNVVAYGGGLIFNNSNLAVEIRQLNTLAAGPVAIADGATDYGTTTSTLVLRAQAVVPALTPGLSGLNIIRSSAMVRRQGT